MSNSKWGAILETSLPLDAFGAPGFVLRERLDFSGHRSGRVTPHVNAELMSGSALIVERDLVSTQLPGFNDMQARKG